MFFFYVIQSQIFNLLGYNTAYFYIFEKIKLFQPLTTDYRTIEIFAAWKRFTPKDGVNLFQAAKIFFGVSL